METPVGEKPAADLRDYLAEERTFLAWIRTGLTLTGFGFVVARFGLFLEVMQINRGGARCEAAWAFTVDWDGVYCRGRGGKSFFDTAPFARD